MENLLPVDGEVYYYPDFFSKAESHFFFTSLVEIVPWKQEPIKIFGKEVLQPRLTAWYGDQGKSYTYSGLTMDPLPWSEVLLEIKNKIETSLKVKFNSVLLNFYRDHSDSMGAHRDNEKELGPNPEIASVSFGATRTFVLKHHKDKTLKSSVELETGSVLLMKGSTQHHWLHSVPKRSRQIGPRLNLTFRRLI